MASNKPEINNYHFQIAELGKDSFCGIIYKDNIEINRTGFCKKQSEAEAEATKLIRTIIFEIRNPAQTENNLFSQSENSDSEIIYQIEGTEIKYTVDKNNIPYPYGNNSIKTSDMKLILLDWEKRLNEINKRGNNLITHDGTLNQIEIDTNIRIFHFDIFRIKTDKENNILDSEIIIKNAELKAEPKTSKIKNAISDYLIKMKLANLPLHISTNENYTEYYVNDNNEKPIYDFILK